MPYQDQVDQMQGAGFSGQEIQSWSDKQAATMLNAGFSESEVNAYQGMKPQPPDTPPIYGRLPTDKDFHNAASVILNGEDHPFYDKAVDGLKSMFTDTGVHPETAVKLAKNIPSFQQIMENEDNQPTAAEYGGAALRSGVETTGSMIKGLTDIATETGSKWAEMANVPTPGKDDIFNPEAQMPYQKGAALQKWIEDKYPVTQAEKNNPIKFGVAGAVGSLVPLIATGGVGMATSGADSAYDEAKQSGASIDKARQQAFKMAPVWGALGVGDVAAFLKPIERSAPGMIPWITAKATQAIRSGAAFSGTNEFGSWLSSEIGQSAGIPIQYKPTLQRIVINALTGAAAGMSKPTGVKQGEAPPPAAEAEPPAGGGGEGPPPAAAGDLIAKTAAEKEAQFTPAYHFDSDSYGVKDKTGAFVQTGLANEGEAAQAAAAKAAPAITAEKPTIEPDALEKHRQTISHDAEALGFNLTPNQLDQAAKLKAENETSANPVEEKTKIVTPSAVQTQTDDIDHALGVIRSGHKAEAEGPKYPIINWLKQRGGIDPDSASGAALRDQLGESRQTLNNQYRGLFVKNRTLSSAGGNKEVGLGLDNIPASEFPFDIKNDGTHVDQKELLNAIDSEVIKAGSGQTSDDPNVENVKAEIQQLGLNTKKMSDPEIKFAIQKSRADQARQETKEHFGSDLGLSDEEANEVHRMRASGNDIIDSVDHVTDKRGRENYEEKSQQYTAENTGQHNEPAGQGSVDRQHEEPVAEHNGPAGSARDAAEHGNIAGDTEQARSTVGPTERISHLFQKFLNDTSGSVILGKSEDKDKVGLLDVLSGIRDTVSPTSAGEMAKQTELAIRGAYGQAKRQVAISEEAMNEHASDALNMTDSEIRDYYRYMEGRSGGEKLKNSKFQEMADAIRNIYSQYKGYIQAMPEARQQAFIDDYFPHVWEKGQDEKIQEFMTHWQQGSKGHLKEREIPTIEDGLNFGLKLEEKNPVRATSKYIASMSNYIASVNVLRAIHNDLGGGYYKEGRQPEGYAPLIGKNAERIEDAKIDEENGQVVPASNLHLYAPKQVADLYNAFLSKGFEDTKLGPAYMIARDAINANTMMELGLSAYHLNTITMQSLNQDMSRILRNGLVGDWHGVTDAVKNIITPMAYWSQGNKLVQQYKNLENHGVDMEKTANLFAKSNMRLGLDPLSKESRSGFYDAYKRGELPDIVDRLKSQISQGHGVGALKSGAEAVSRIVSDVSHPLFQTYIPAVKMSAFHDLMGDWLRQNPGASDDDIAKNNVRISNLIESRFGEMNMENIFWNQKAKELLGLTFRAPGWDYGLIHQVGGAAKDVFSMINDAVRQKGFDANKLDRPLFMVGSVMAYVAMNVAGTYLKTGVMPSDQKMMDAIAYATGGLHKAFGMHAERAELPGHARELLQMTPNPGQGPLSGVEQEIKNKTATLPRNIYKAATNTDWRGKPIYDPKSNDWVAKTPGVAQVAHIVKGFEPFAMESLLEGKQPGSNLSLAERFMGVRAAGAKITAPAELKNFNEHHHN